MIANYARNQYQEMQVQTSPERLVVMLYEGALSFLERGIDALQRGDIDGQARFLGKTQDIVCHLMATLDMTVGPIAEQLEGMYRYCLKRLLAGHAGDDLSALEEVAGILRELRDGFAHAERTVSAERQALLPALQGACA
jgi:flagellar protein FliS